jgi:glycosyltransferase involved in cell wall biosynthesis
VVVDDIPEKYIIRMGVFSNFNFWEQIDLWAYMKEKKSGILLSLCNTGPVLTKNQVVCIHDMSYQSNPGWFSKSFHKYYSFLIPRLAKRSLHILTVSSFSKKEICEKLDIPHQKVSVISNAPAKEFLVADSNIIHSKSDQFFLFVGSHDPRKNIKLLIKVFSLKEYRDLQLIIIGAPSRSFKNEEFVPPPNIRFITDCNDTSLAEYYKNARALINSSFYEGFGLSIIEAMASGCPLILSDIPAFKEVAQKNAIYFDPYSHSSLKVALNKFLKKTDEEINSTILSNYNRSLNYNWEVSSGKLMNLLQGL